MRQRLTGGRRVLGVDVARALALLGMMSVHIFPGVRLDGSLHPAYVVAAGRSAALFAVLAGVGLALATGGQQRYDGRRLRAARAGVLARAALLLGLGLLLGEVNSPPLVILAYYGLLFVVAVPCLGLSPRALAALAVISAAVAPALSHAARMHLDVAPIAEPGGRHLVAELLLTGTYPVLPWTTYLFVGLALGRLDLRRRATALWLLAGGAALAVAAKVGSGALLGAAGGVDRLRATVPGDKSYAFLAKDLDRFLREGMFGTTPTTDWRWLLISAPHSSTTLDLVHTSATAAAVLGLCLLVARYAPRWLYLPLAAAGSMTLTLYTAHVLSLTNGSPLLVTSNRFQLWLGQVVVVLLVATFWRTQVGRGPLEWLASRVDRAARRLVTGRAAEPTPASVSE
jgi:Heparan-alpha-glucosaminide N-acetyltransferase, catalytic